MGVIEAFYHVTNKIGFVHRRRVAKAELLEYKRDWYRKKHESQQTLYTFDLAKLMPWRAVNLETNKRKAARARRKADA